MSAISVTRHRRDAITYLCPVYGAIATLTAACPGCGRGAGRARRLACSSIDASLVALAAEVHRSRAVFERALARWQSVQATRDTLVSAILASQSAPIESSSADHAASADEREVH